MERNMTEEIAAMWADILGGEVFHGWSKYSVGFPDAVTHRIDPSTLLDTPRKCFEFAMGEAFEVRLRGLLGAP